MMVQLKPIRTLRFVLLFTVGSMMMMISDVTDSVDGSTINELLPSDDSNNSINNNNAATSTTCMTIDETGNTVIDDRSCVDNNINNTNESTTTNTTVPTTTDHDSKKKKTVDVTEESASTTTTTPTSEGGIDKDTNNNDEQHADDDDDESLLLGSDIGVLQSTDIEYGDRIYAAIKKARQYIRDYVIASTTSASNEEDFDTNHRTIVQQQKHIQQSCRNTHESCTFWSLNGECTTNFNYMHQFCAPVCQTCSELLATLSNNNGAASTDDNDDEDEEEEEEVDEETRAKNIAHGSDIGVIQSIADDDAYKERILTAIQTTQQYMYEQVHVDPKFTAVKHICRNTHESCTYWSLIGECTANPGYMIISCAPACQTCEQVHVETRCPMNEENATFAFQKKNDLNDFYERILSDPYYKSQYNVTVLSRPTYADGDSVDSTDLSYVVTGLWILQLDNIVNETEAQRLIDMGMDEGYERSADVGAAKEDGTFDSSVNDGRTSTNAWCMAGGCMEDPVTVSVHDRIENITTIPRMNYENLQILQYHENQYYNEHNDFIEYQVQRPCGSRILTFYIYLNTVPDEGGGGTNFPKSNLTVTPKLGRAILWPSILNDQPFAMDPLSNHQALPVRNQHVKYGVNAWIHQRDFQTANNVGCA